MKTLLILAAVAVAVCSAAVSSINRPVGPYNPEQIKGNVRVVLLRVDRTMVFSDAGLRENLAQKIYAIPGLSVVYVVEIFGNEPVKHWNTVLNGKIARGKRLEETAIENLAGGGLNSSKEYEHYDWAILKKPSVTNPKRTHVIEIWERGLRVSSGKVDLHITTGFNDRTEEFVFDGVPLE